MEQTFMTIHNLTTDANILFASESIFDILGYAPAEVLGRSSFDYFHPDEVPFARSVHSRGILLDKAAVLHYARIISRDGHWISCECCFTIVHDVIVACTSIYRRGERSERRAIEAPQIRRLFSCSPRDPRYHMLEHLSPKFRMPPTEREPRAALILNRFSRTLSVMFVTEAINSILGVSAEQILHKSFYECIRETSLPDAFNCLESAKANDSIAYLRFWSRDPRRPEDFESDGSEGDDEEEDEGEDENEEEIDNVGGSQMEPGNTQTWNEGRQLLHGHRLPETRCSSDSEGGGVVLEVDMDIDTHHDTSPQIKTEPDIDTQYGGNYLPEPSLSSSRHSPAAQTQTSSTWTSSMASTPHEYNPPRMCRRTRQELAPSVELEAVVSCTSDGLVVILRRARPQIPSLHPPQVPFEFGNGLFAAPWGQRPTHPQWSPDALYNIWPPLLPQNMPARGDIKAVGGPPLDQLMSSIRDVAVFAWALVGINGKMASHSHGLPMGEAQPPGGLPVWDSTAPPSSYLGPENQAAQRWMSNANRQEDAAWRSESFVEISGLQTSVNNSIVPEHGNHSFDNGKQSRLRTQPQEQLTPHIPYHTFTSSSDSRDQFLPQQDVPFVQMGVPAPRSTGEWDEEIHARRNRCIPSETEETPRYHSHNWYP
ncbi:hypothetical protein B0J13DRAFT_70679 [Dactylonectria estremocensis]|uniref:PAS domain-containing protein n=1 Tax=Dactylonectria estremocensis TaxID=1079267 RepID=A0A9P9EHB7_9HYPO|nr:hypothetical protein B0J13DRAFT_70679 [Dactylonectria estremocensis]